MIESPGDVLGFAKTLMIELGVWDTMTYAIQAVIIIAVSSFLLRFVR